MIHNSRNSGKGFSVREGLKVSTGNYIIFQDADLEYDPKEFKKFAKVCKDFDADVVIGVDLIIASTADHITYTIKLVILF